MAVDAWAQEVGRGLDLKLPARGGNGPVSAGGDLGRGLNLKRDSPDVR